MQNILFACISQLIAFMIIYKTWYSDYPRTTKFLIDKIKIKDIIFK